MAINKVSKIVFVMLWHITERTGGAEVQANYLAVDLAKRGYDVSYICQTVNIHKIGTDEIVLNDFSDYFEFEDKQFSQESKLNYENSSFVSF